MRNTLGRTDVSWDTRIYPGVAVRAVPSEVRDQLAQALGALGVEAEYVLNLVAPFTHATPTTPASRTEGERFLWQLEAAGRRLITAADDLEIATQSYLGSLEAENPLLRPPVGRDGTWEDGLASAWWPPVDTSDVADGPIELSLRQCGYAYRHVVAAHLATNVAGIGEQLALLLHALGTLPPAGVLPQTSLYAGLYELSEALQGHMVPHNLRDMSPEVPGLLSGLALLRRLDTTEDRSLEADLAWTRAQLAQIEALAAQQPAAAKPPADASRRGWLGLFRRKSAASPHSSNASSAAAFASQATREWTATIAALEALRQQTGAAPTR